MYGCPCILPIEVIVDPLYHCNSRCRGHYVSTRCYLMTHLMDCGLKVGALLPSNLSTSSYTASDRCAFILLTGDVGSAPKSEVLILQKGKHLIIDMHMC